MLHDVISRPVIAVIAVTRLLPVAAHIIENDRARNQRNVPSKDVYFASCGNPYQFSPYEN